MNQTPNISTDPEPALRVLLVTARYLPYVGGTEIHNYEVARRLAASGVDVTVLTTDASGKLAPEEVTEGFRVIRVPAWARSRDLYIAPGIYRTIMQQRWDVIHCQGYHTSVAPLAMWAALRAGTPYITTFHSGGHSSSWRSAIRGTQVRMLRPLLVRAQRLVAVSEFEKRHFCQQLGLPEDRVVVIPNGSHLPAQAVSSEPDQRDPLIVSVGRLERYKGHHRAIAALPHVLAEMPDVRLRIVGSGPYENELRQLADQLGIADRVEIGPIAASDRTAMARLISSAALLTLLSDYELQGLAVSEGLSLGTPVLVADASALGDLARQGIVHAVPLDADAQSVAQAMIEMMRHPAPRPKVELPSWDDCAARLLALYRTVTSSSGLAAKTDRAGQVGTAPSQEYQREQAAARLAD